MRRPTVLAPVAAVAAVATFGLAPSRPAAAATGRDVSFPQCRADLPSPDHAAFGVLGANGGASFTTNPCLVSQLRWAKRLAAAPAFYMNTGNPGPARARRWPLGQARPIRCTVSDPNSLGCAYDYGWNAARYAFARATDAAQILHRVSRTNAQRRVANVDWWLDVEILNSWQTLDGDATRDDGLRDTATIAGAIESLRNLGAERVGVYSTTYQWNAITGGPKLTGRAFAHVPVWLAGFDDHADALAGCHRRSFTGGRVMLTQYLGADGFDADVACT